MSDQMEVRGQTKDLQMPSREGVAVEAPDTAPAQKKTTLKEMLTMAVCCAAPLLVLSIIPLFLVSLLVHSLLWEVVCSALLHYWRVRSACI